VDSNNLIERLGTHAKNLGRLSVSILEHYVQELTGEKAIEILKEPYEREKRLLLLVDALYKTESEIKNGKLLLGKYLDVQIKNSSDLMQAMVSFQDDIDFSSLTEKLTAEFKIAFSEDLEADLNKNAKIYASILQKKVVSVSDETVVSRITAATLLDIREFLSQQIRGSETDARQLELLQKMVELLQQLINQTHLTADSKQKKSQSVAFEIEATSLYYGIQGAMRECKTIRNRVKDLYDNFGITDYAPGATVQDNIDRLAIYYCEHPGKMLSFLDNVKSTESKDGGSTYSKEFVELLLKWKKFPKTEDDQKEFLVWLVILTEKVEDNIQRLKLISAIKTPSIYDNEKKIYKEYVLYVVIKKELHLNDYYRCNLWACRPDFDIMGEKPFNVDTFEVSISSCIREYISDKPYPSRVELIVPLELIYKLRPEKWRISNYGTLGYHTRITLREYETLRLINQDQIRRQDIRKSFLNEKVVKWVSDLYTKDDQVSNFVVLHRVPKDINNLWFWLERYPYMLITRDDFDPDTDGHIFLKDKLKNIDDDVPLQIRDIRRTCNDLNSDFAHSVAVIWDDGENIDNVLELVPDRRKYTS
jgi:hypothetical protein